MIELAVGTRFYCEGRLCEVYANDDLDHCCDYCVLPDDVCSVMDCGLASREDGKNVCFKWVEE